MMPEPIDNPTILFVGGAGRREAPFWNGVAESCARRGVRFFGVFQGFWEERPCEIAFPHMFTGHFDQEFVRLFSAVQPSSSEETAARLATIVVSQLRPQLAIVWNGIDRAQHTWLQSLQELGVTTLVAERGAFPGVFVLEKEGINGFSELLWDQKRLERVRTAISDEDADRVHRVLELVRRSRAVSYSGPGDAPGTDLRQRLQLGSDEKIVLFLGSWDEAAGIGHPDPHVRLAQSPLFESSRTAALALAEAVKTLSNCHLILRPHPFDRLDWSSIAEGHSVHLLPDGDVTDLIEQVDVVAGLTTNLLYQVAAYEKPVLAMGKTALYGHGFSYDVGGLDQLLPALQQSLSRTAWEARLLARDRFFAEYLFRFCYSAEEDFQRLGVSGPEQAAAHVIGQIRQVTHRIPDASTPLSALGAAVTATNRRIQEMDDQIRALEQQVANLERYRRSLFLFLRFRAGNLIRTLKRVPVLGVVARGLEKVVTGGKGL